MELEAVSYRYTWAELSVLMSLHGCQGIPCLPDMAFPDKADFEKGLSSLEDSDVLSDAGGRLLLDQVHALLIGRLCRCVDYLSLEGNGKSAVLCDGGNIALLVHGLPGGVRIQAAPRLRDLTEDFLSAALRFPGGSAVKGFRQGAEILEAAAANGDQMRQIAENALAEWLPPAEEGFSD